MIFFIWMLCVGASWAQDEEAEEIKKAKQAYKYGEQLFNEGNYPEAIKAFQRAYEITQRYQLLFNLALSYQFSADLEQARYYFEEYQRKAPAEQWNEAQQRIDNIDKIVAERIKKEEENPVVEDTPVLPEKRTATWIVPTLWGIGVMGTAGGLYFGISSQSKSGLLLEHCNEQICTDQASSLFSAAKTDALFADVAWGLGLSALGGALWMHVSKGQNLSVTPGYVQLRGDF